MPTSRQRRPLVTFLELEQERSAQIQRILQQAAGEVERDIRRAAQRNLNPLTRAQYDAVRASIYARLYQGWGDIGSAVAAGRVAAAELAAKVTFDQMSPLLRRFLPDAQVNAIIASEEARAVETVELAMRRLDSSYIPLSSRVYRWRGLLGGQVDQKVNAALARGLNARQFAAEMTRFIRPDTPGGMSYAAMRLARTELNNAFHAASVLRYQENRVVTDVDWHLSRSHPERDDCDDLAAEGPYPVEEVPRKPHPHCFCYITPTLLTADELLAGLSSGGGDYAQAPWFRESGMAHALLGLGAGLIVADVGASAIKSLTAKQIKESLVPVPVQ